MVKLNQVVRGRADSKQFLRAPQFWLSISVAKCPLLSKLNRTFCAVEARFPLESLTGGGEGINAMHDISSIEAKKASMTRATPLLSLSNLRAEHLQDLFPADKAPLLR